MPQRMTPQNATMDGPTLLLAIGTVLLLAFALTPAGIFAAAIPIVLHQVTRRDFLVIWVLVVALGLTLLSVHFGDFSALKDAYAEAVAAGLDQGAERWLSIAKQPSAWICTAPVGLAIGAGRTLIVAGRKRSALAALTHGRVLSPPARSPIAYVMHKLAERNRSRRNNMTVLGTDWITGAKVAINDEDLTRHVLVCGTTGSGKTTSALNLVEGCEGGMVIVDGKGDADLALRMLAFARRRGQKTYLFDGTNPKRSAAYNPLAAGDFTSLADRIVELREWTEPYYKKAAQRFAQSAFKTLQACGTEIDLASVMKALDTEFLLSTIKLALKSRKFDKDTAKLLMDEVVLLRVLERDIGGLRAEIHLLGSSVLGPLFDIARAKAEQRAIIDLQRARTENALVYFCLPSLRYPEFARNLGALVINDLKFVASTSQTPWNIFLDEFSIFAGPQVLNLLNQGRGFNIRMTLATQSLADIAQGSDKDKEKFVDQVFGSVNAYVIHRLNSAADAELMAATAGTVDAVEYTAQTAGGKGTGAASARHARAFRIHPDEIKNLPKGAAYFANKNNEFYRLIMARRPDI